MNCDAGIQEKKMRRADKRTIIVYVCVVNTRLYTAILTTPTSIHIEDVSAAERVHVSKEIT